MTSRERIQAALQHRDSDRLPIDFGGHRSSGIMAKAYVKLRDYLDLPKSELFVYDFIQQLALVEDDVLDRIGADVVELGHDYLYRSDYWKDWELSDGTPCRIPSFIEVERTTEGNVVRGDEDQVICIQKNDCDFYEQTCFPYLDVESSDFSDLPHKLNQIMWCRLGIPPAPAGYDEPGLAVLREAARQLRANTDRAIYATFGGNLVEIGEFCFRIDQFLYLLAAEPDRVNTYLDRLMELHLDNLEKYLAAVGEYIDIIGFGDDLGMQTGPQFSPQMYREFFKPRHKILWNRAKELAPHVAVSLHSCGGLYPLIPDLIEAGLDAMNPVQFTCTNMELDRLKREFGRDLVFWGGGCDTRDVLPKGTPEQIRKHVAENVRTMAPGGGFVFQQVHNILADVPPANVMAMFDAAREAYK